MNTFFGSYTFKGFICPWKKKKTTKKTVAYGIRCQQGALGPRLFSLKDWVSSVLVPISITWGQCTGVQMEVTLPRLQPSSCSIQSEPLSITLFSLMLAISQLAISDFSFPKVACMNIC